MAPARLGILVLTAGLLYAASDAEERLDDSAAVLTDIMAAPDKGIPQDLLEKAECVVVVPGVKKGAFIFGGKYGKGFTVCRKAAGWSAPAATRIEGGSFGFQIGVSETDVVMLVMNDSGVRKLLQSRFTLGADASVAAGPVGRTSSAETDAQMHAEILSWSRTRGLFAGLALQGATLRPDDDWNSDLYGSALTNREIVTGKTRPPAAANKLITALSRYAGRRPAK